MIGWLLILFIDWSIWLLINQLIDLWTTIIHSFICNNQQVFAALEETFIRSQVAAISLTFLDFPIFTKFADEMLPRKKPLLDPSWLLFIGFHWFLRISWDLMNFRWFHGSRVKEFVATFADEMLPLKNLYSIPDGCYFIDFHGFVKIS